MFYFCGLISFLHTSIHLLLFQMNKCIVCHIYHLPIYLPTHNIEVMIKTSVINSDFHSLLKNECLVEKKEAFKANLNGNFILYHIFISMILQKMTFFSSRLLLFFASFFSNYSIEIRHILCFVLSLLLMLINSFIYVFFSVHSNIREYVWG